MPGSRLEVFSQAGHFPHHSDQTRFLSVIREFISSTQPASYAPEEWRELLRRGRPQGHATVGAELAEQTLATSAGSGT